MKPTDPPEDPVSPEALRRGIEIFLEHAYEGPPPPRVLKYLPPPGPLDPERYLMSDLVEREPDTDIFGDVRSFLLRLGAWHYRHFKLRLARPHPESKLVFMVERHDEFLEAPPGSPDAEGLERLKRISAEIAGRILRAWREAGLPTAETFEELEGRESAGGGGG